METVLHYVTSEDIDSIRDSLKDRFTVEIDYAQINSDSDYLNCMSELFNFPKLPGIKGYSWDAYYDWMTDFTWNQGAAEERARNGYALIIHGCNKNGYDNRFDKLLREIIDSFVYDILPWHTKDVIDHVVCGEPKSFHVYLVI